MESVCKEKEERLIGLSEKLNWMYSQLTSLHKESESQAEKNAQLSHQIAVLQSDISSSTDLI